MGGNLGDGGNAEGVRVFIRLTVFAQISAEICGRENRREGIVRSRGASGAPRKSPARGVHAAAHDGSRKELRSARALRGVRAGASLRPGNGDSGERFAPPERLGGTTETV